MICRVVCCARLFQPTINRYGVIPGQRLVVMTSNDSGYQAAIDWQQAGREVVAVVDTREGAQGDLVNAARARGITIFQGSGVIDVKGKSRVQAVEVAKIDVESHSARQGTQQLVCDTVATSGGWSPVVHLSSHTGRRPVWNPDVLGFVPAPTTEPNVGGRSGEGRQRYI